MGWYLNFSESTGSSWINRPNHKCQLKTRKKNSCILSKKNEQPANVTAINYQDGQRLRIHIYKSKRFLARRGK